MPKQKRARERPKKNWMEGIRKTMNERNLNEGQWEDRKQWSLGVGQRRKTFRNRYAYIHSNTQRRRIHCKKRVNKLDWLRGPRDCKSDFPELQNFLSPGDKYP